MQADAVAAALAQAHRSEWAFVLSATVRAYPAIDSGFFYVRNDNTLLCLDLRR